MPFSIMIYLNNNCIPWCLVLILAIAVALLSYPTKVFLDVGHYKLKNTTTTEIFSPSSVWCNNGPLGEKLCRFRNICYDPRFQEFQFMMTDESVLSGVQSTELWKSIDMSTVLDHNAFKMKVSIMSSKNKIRRKSVHFHKTTFIIHRFKPDNIMHVIHDDLMPLYFTMESIFDRKIINKRQFALAFSDNYKESILDDWYNQFSSSPIKRLPYLNETVCFDNAYVGLHRATLWFNYGFRNPQGPYINNNFNPNGLRNFVEYNLNAWKINSDSHCSSDLKCTKVVIVIRSHSRRILNLKELILALERAHGEIYPNHKLDIVEIDFAAHDPSFILTHLQYAKLIVGMHGAGLILSLFLPPKSSVVEMFPFAINPDNVSFLKALFQQQQAYPLNYQSWQNQDRTNSVPSPIVDPLLGGISHLPAAMQNHIKSLSEVPPVKCCHDPAYLFYMYHDTFVTKDVYGPILRAFVDMQAPSVVEASLLKHVFPSSPSFVFCSVSETSVSVEWGELSNAQENEGLWFQITFLIGEHVKIENVKNVSTKTISMSLTGSVKSVQMWFQPFNGKNASGYIIHENCSK